MFGSHRYKSGIYLLLSALIAAATVLASPALIAQNPGTALTAAQNGLFAVTVTGNGVPIILIPGLSSSGDVWNGTVDHLKATYQCHVVTLAGFAGQPAWPGVDKGKFILTVEDQLAAYIRANKMQKPILIGHSLGGFLALQFAERYPDLAGHLVIVDSVPFTAGAFFQVDNVTQGDPIAMKMRTAIKDESDDQYQRFVKSGVSTRGMVTSDADFATITQWGLTSDKTTVADAMYEMLETDARSKLKAIHADALIFATWAGMPGATSKDVQAAFVDQYAGLKSKKIVMAGKERHFIMLDNPAWFYAQLDAFLATPPAVAQIR